MLPRALRLQLWKKMAQTTPNLPTEQVAQTKPVSGSPPTFVASQWYPSMLVGFQAKNIPWINGLTNLLNVAMFYTSNGQISMPWMRQQNFIFGADQVPSVDLRNLMNFSKLIYQHFFTDLGQPYQQALTPQQIADKINLLRNSPFFTNLSATSPTGQLAAHIGGNLRELIRDYLQQIK